MAVDYDETRSCIEVMFETSVKSTLSVTAEHRITLTVWSVYLQISRERHPILETRVVNYISVIAPQWFELVRKV
jgi:hypothetical protein